MIFQSSLPSTLSEIEKLSFKIQQLENAKSGLVSELQKLSSTNTELVNSNRQLRTQLSESEKERNVIRKERDQLEQNYLSLTRDYEMILVESSINREKKSSTRLSYDQSAHERKRSLESLSQKKHGLKNSRRRTTHNSSATLAEVIASEAEWKKTPAYLASKNNLGVFVIQDE